MDANQTFPEVHFHYLCAFLLYSDGHILLLVRGFTNVQHRYLASIFVTSHWGNLAEGTGTLLFHDWLEYHWLCTACCFWCSLLHAIHGTRQKFTFLPWTKARQHHPDFHETALLCKDLWGLRFPCSDDHSLPKGSCSIFHDLSALP